MSWLLRNWQLKLLALALSVGLFAALAFSENPIQFSTVDAKISYNNRPPGLILMLRAGIAGVRASSRHLR